MKPNRQDGYGGVTWMCARLYLVLHQGVKYFTIDHSHSYTNKARKTHVMLVWASATSLACAQSPKSLSDGRPGSKPDGQLPKRGLQMPKMNTTRALLGKNYDAAQPDMKMMYPPVRSVTKNCARQHL